MHYSSCSASISIYIQHIVNLSINTLQFTKLFQATEWLRNLLEYDGSQDEHLIFKMEASLFDENLQTNKQLHCIMICVMDTRFELCTIQGGCRIIMKLFSSCFRLLYCVMAAGFLPDD